MTVKEVLEGPEGQSHRSSALCPGFGGAMEIINSEEQMSGLGPPKITQSPKKGRKKKKKKKVANDELCDSHFYGCQSLQDSTEDCLGTVLKSKSNTHDTHMNV